jgi:hypothetical protein
MSSGRENGFFAPSIFGTEGAESSKETSTDFTEFTACIFVVCFVQSPAD